MYMLVILCFCKVLLMILLLLPLLLLSPLLLKVRLNILLLKSMVLFFSTSHCSQFHVFSIRVLVKSNM